MNIRRWITSPAPVWLILAVALAVPALTYVANHRPVATSTHEIVVSASSYPANFIASWRDTYGDSHALDPYTGSPVRVPARSVELAVTADTDIQCIVTVDGVTVDIEQAAAGKIAICSWPRT